MVAKIEDIEHCPAWPRLLSPKQAAAYCGMTPETMRRYIDVKPSKFGRRVLFDRAEIDKYLDKVKNGANDDWTEAFDGDDQD